MFRLAVLLTVVIAAVVPASLHAQDRLVVFGGYSYFRPPVTATETFVCTEPVCSLNPVAIAPFNVTNSQNLNGWELSATYRFLPFLGVAADFSGYYGTAVAHSGSNVHQHNYLFGPEVSFPARVSPFAHVLVGGTHQSISAGSIPTTGGVFDISSTGNSAFATVVGAGIDLKVLPHIWIRPIQIDYMATKLHSSTQNQPRVSAGLVLHF